MDPAVLITSKKTVEFSDILVYNKADFMEMLQVIERISEYFARFEVLIGDWKDEPQFADIYPKLLAEPDIAKALSRLNRGQKPLPSEPR